MRKRPYPGVPPNYTPLDLIGAQHRTCIVVDLRSSIRLTPNQVALLAEHLEATAQRLAERIPELREVVIATSEQLDRLALDGLRLSQ